MEIPRKEKIFICHEKGNIVDVDFRENMPVWRNVRNLFEQFKEHTSGLRFSNTDDLEKLKLYTSYFQKIVEHYDIKIPEFTIFPLCSIIDSIGKLKFGNMGNKRRFLKAIEEYFDPQYASDPDFIESLSNFYTKERSPLTHEAERLGLMAQVGSTAQISSFVKDQNGNYVFGAKHLFHIAIEVTGNYFEEISIH
ncbi:MAG: hypothetical protein P8X70_00505 [Nanoarchaeota archaeon]